MPFEGKFAGVFRCDDTARSMQLHAGRSDDGIAWQIDSRPSTFSPLTANPCNGSMATIPPSAGSRDRYYVTWCNGYHGPTIGMAWTRDFETFHQMEIRSSLFQPQRRALSAEDRREIYDALGPSDNGHTPFGDIYVSQSPDLIHWGVHRHVMSPNGGWQSTKIGAGPIPIETKHGWLMFYHGVLTSCNGFVYSFARCCSIWNSHGRFSIARIPIC